MPRQREDIYPQSSVPGPPEQCRPSVSRLKLGESLQTVKPRQLRMRKSISCHVTDALFILAPYCRLDVQRKNYTAFKTTLAAVLPSSTTPTPANRTTVMHPMSMARPSLLATQAMISPSRRALARAIISKFTIVDPLESLPRTQACRPNTTPIFLVTNVVKSAARSGGPAQKVLGRFATSVD
ncbi:hypothetical protein IF1G_07079 [Cordyceps javanica]|uniref:Uncharacterized protein n=1 Tax=Cordyceps javanica TaxID=43265 RepID=A0A545UXK8_9HYPO|nr:hypothetical protein IF1G_07079 [Cordyceps javanica]